MKPFLLIAGSRYYPSAYTDDWHATYKTREEADSQILTVENHQYFSKGPRKGQIKNKSFKYMLKDNGRSIDWYEIVDLRKWIDL